MSPQWSNYHSPPVIVNNTELYRLNGPLIVKQGLSDETVHRIIETHQFKYFLTGRMLRAETPEEIRRIGSIFTSLFFYQQSLWGFDRDDVKHNWRDIPYCSCYLSHGQKKIPRSTCLVHSHLIKSS